MKDKTLYYFASPKEKPRELLVYARSRQQAARVAIIEMGAICRPAKQTEIVRLVSAGVMPIEANSDQGELRLEEDDGQPLDFVDAEFRPAEEPF